MEDADFQLELKNYPETRKFAIASHDKVKRWNHLKWLKNNIIGFQVIENNSQRIGAVRVHEGVISIWIDRQFWGLGVATEVIKRVAQKGHTAIIVDGNVASLRAFIKAGFLPVAHSAITKNYFLEK